MAVLKEMFKEEKERLIKMKKFYMDKIMELPKGSIVFKKRGDTKYPYLVYRTGKKIKTDYLKLNNDELKELKLNTNYLQNPLNNWMSHKYILPSCLLKQHVQGLCYYIIF